MQFISYYDSPLGRLIVICNESAITELRFDNQNASNYPNISSITKECTILCKKWLDLYFSGIDPYKIAVPIELSGTSFQLKVWNILQTIPYGKTLAYSEIAKQISQTMSAQAVGQAVHRNPIAIIIPCHRVIGLNGQLTGYASGLDKKEALLKLEKVLV